VIERPRRRPRRKRPEAKNSNAPPEGSSWIWWTKEMYESFAFRELIRRGHAYSLLTRVALEHLRHGGQENGRLAVTYDNFQEWGIPRKAIPEAIAVAEALGFIERTKRGRASWEDQRESGEFAITWQGIGSELPTNAWRRIFSAEAAQAKVMVALKQRAEEKARNRERGIARHLRTPRRTQFIAASKTKSQGSTETISGSPRTLKTRS
jgi:hypothetical protein